MCAQGLHQILQLPASPSRRQEGAGLPLARSPRSLRPAAAAAEVLVAAHLCWQFVEGMTYCKACCSVEQFAISATIFCDFACCQAKRIK